MNTSFIQNAWSSSRPSLISVWRTLNTSVDLVFYDIGALSAEEQETLTQHTGPLGEILVVHPRAANQRLQHYTSLEFVKKQQAANGEAISTLVVAGVGSSALGTACLARNLADYLGQPVAGIVSGLGMADVMTEALGGWFVFGGANALRDALARTFQTAGLQDHVRHQRSHDAIKQHFAQQGLDPESFLYGNPASTALLYLLSALGLKIKLLVGHSKGNYCIENALEGLHQMAESSGRTPPLAHLQIITLGAVIWFGPECTHLQQFLGQIDALGLLNSRPDLSFVTVPGAWHSLNGRLLGHMPVAQVLQAAGVRRGGTRTPSPRRRAGFKRGGSAARRRPAQPTGTRTRALLSNGEHGRPATTPASARATRLGTRAESLSRA